jgi:hypothetical protein
VAVKIRNKIASVAVAVVASMGILPTAAHADVGSRANVPVTLSGTTLSSVLNVSFGAGDCHEWGQDYFPYHNTSAVYLNLLDTFGDVQLTWFGVTRTDHSWSTDVWHGWFVFKDSAGNVLLSTQNSKLNSPNMDPTAGNDTEFSRTQTLFMNPTLFTSITRVDYFGDC